MHWKTSRLITVINSWSNRIPCNCSIWPLVSMNIFSFWHPLREISPSRKLRESATPDRGWSWQCCGWRLMVASQATGPGLPSVAGGRCLVSPGMAGDTVCGWWLPVVVSGCEEGRALAQISSGLPPQSSGGDPCMRGRPFKIKLRTINTETASSTVKCFHFICFAMQNKFFVASLLWSDKKINLEATAKRDCLTFCSLREPELSFQGPQGPAGSTTVWDPTPPPSSVTGRLYFPRNSRHTCFVFWPYSRNRPDSAFYTPLSQGEGSCGNQPWIWHLKDKRKSSIKQTTHLKQSQSLWIYALSFLHISFNWKTAACLEKVQMDKQAHTGFSWVSISKLSLIALPVKPLQVTWAVTSQKCADEPAEQTRQWLGALSSHCSKPKCSCVGCNKMPLWPAFCELECISFILHRKKKEKKKSGVI